MKSPWPIDRCSSYRVIEYWPEFVDRSDKPREELVSNLDGALEIPWLKEKGDLKLKGTYVLHNELVVAIIFPCAGAIEQSR